MPSLGADMEKGTIVEWLVTPGDTVRRGDVVALVETDKGIIEIEIWHGGEIESILVPAGETVAVGAVLATLRGADDDPDLRRPRVSPRARAVAAELGVEVAGLAAPGPINEADVRTAAATAGSQNTDAMRSAIARTMTRSKQTIPHYYLSTTIDMTRALGWLQGWNDSHRMTERMLPAALLLRATSLAVGTVPEMNGHHVDGRFEQADAVHLGVAISLRGGGLVAPAIMNCDALTLSELMIQLTDLVQRARTGRLRETEMSAPTLTVTNLGDRGVDAGIWRNRPAPGRHRVLWNHRRETSRGRRCGCRPQHRHRNPVRRSPGVRRAPRRTVPRSHRHAPSESGGSMNVTEARTVIIAAMTRVAPEIDPATIDDDLDLTRQLDLDSMDYLQWMLEINRTTGIEIPERDYDSFMTVADATRYLVAAN